MHSPLRSFPILLTLVVGFVLVSMYAVKRPLPLVRAALLPVQPLQLQMGPNGATIQALFGRFPAVPVLVQPNQFLSLQEGLQAQPRHHLFATLPDVRTVAPI